MRTRITGDLMNQSGALSEPEGNCSSCNSYENSTSESEFEEEFFFEKEEELIHLQQRKYSEDSKTSHSLYLKRPSSEQSKCDHILNESLTKSKESLSVINEERKNWWYWCRFALFMASPFIARQLGIIVGKRILSRIFRAKY